MKFVIATATLLSFVPSLLALTLNTPASLVTCQPTLLTWSNDGQAPFYPSILPGGQASAQALKTFPAQQGNSLTWNVDLAAGTGITVALKDSTGNTVFSDVVTIQAGSDSGCVNTSIQESATGSGAPAGTSGTAGNTVLATAPATTGSGAASSSASNASTKATSTGAKPATSTSSSTSASNAASKLELGAYSLAGVMSLVGLAVF